MRRIPFYEFHTKRLQLQKFPHVIIPRPVIEQQPQPFGDQQITGNQQSLIGHVLPVQLFHRKLQMRQNVAAAGNLLEARVKDAAQTRIVGRAVIEAAAQCGLKTRY
jgi:hypothetical protein